MLLIAPNGRIYFIEVKHPNGKGRLSIRYNRLEELEGILEHIR